MLSHQRTGAALTRLLVNTPAAAKPGPSLITTATSGSAGRLQPGGHPGGPEALRRGHSDARQCRFLQRWTGRSRGYSHGRQAGRLRQAEGKVEALHGGAGGALGQVVERRDDDDPARGLDRAPPAAAPCSHRASRRWSATVRPAADARKARRRRPSRTTARTSSTVTPACAGRADGGQDAPRHRHQHRREGHGDRRPAAADRFCIISGVCRCTPPTPYADAAPITSEPSRFTFGDLPAPEVPEAATTTTSGFDQPGGQRRRDGQRRRGRVAAGHGDPGGAAQGVAAAG